MNGWKGRWKCQKCGNDFSADYVREFEWHLDLTGKTCDGLLVPYDRRRAAPGTGNWHCKAQKNVDPPQDCDWPHCGCDPHAEKVVSALIEEGWRPPAGDGHRGGGKRAREVWGLAQQQLNGEESAKVIDAALEQIQREADTAGYRRGVEVMLEAAIDEAVNACGFEQRARVRAARLLSESKEVPK